MHGDLPDAFGLYVAREVGLRCTVIAAGNVDRDGTWIMKWITEHGGGVCISQSGTRD